MARLRRWSVWFFCTDNWKVYPREIPEDDLIQGKRGTVRIERNNARQRHWFARFKRKSQVVSRSLRMVDLTISLFARFHVNGQREDILSFFQQYSPFFLLSVQCQPRCFPNPQPHYTGRGIEKCQPPCERRLTQGHLYTRSILADHTGSDVFAQRQRCTTR